MQLLADNSTVAFHSLIDIFLSLIKNLSSFRGLGLVSDSVFGCVRDAGTGKPFFACTCQKIVVTFCLQLCKQGVLKYKSTH